MKIPRSPHWKIICVMVLLASLVYVSVVFLAEVSHRPAIVIENKSGYTLRQIEFGLSHDGMKSNPRCKELDPDAELKLSNSTSDLVIEYIHYECQGRFYQWQEGGIATTGETLRLRIDENGKLSASYDSFGFSGQ